MKGYAALIGAIAGLLAARHWLGAVIGALVGVAVEAGLFRFLTGSKGAGSSSTQTSVTALFALLGRLAKIDGRVDPSEIAVCERLMQRLDLDARGRSVAIHAFQYGKRQDSDLAMAFATLRQSRRHAPLYLDVFIDMAMADGRLDASERQLLGKYAWMLGIRESTLEMLLNRRSARHRSSPTAPINTEPYAVLGIERSASDEDVRRAFRKLVSRHHPDKLAAKGAAPEVIRLAQERTQEILAAYEAIKTARGMRG